MTKPPTPEHGPGVEEVWYDESDGRWWGSDEHGEFPLLAGSPYPVEKGSWNEFKEKRIKYHPCGRVLKFTLERYGEKRYCTGISSSPEDTCKHHKSRLNMDEQQKENFKTGAFTESYDAIFEYLPPHKQVMANELYRSLIEESTYDFGERLAEREIDTSEWEGLGDSVTILHPIPTDHEVRCMALWFAALDFMVMQNIRQEQFKVAAQEGLAVGEKEFERESEAGQVYTVVDEHHLNLPLSRVQKDYAHHLKFGGVVVEDEAQKAEMTEREWVIEIRPDEEVVDERHEEVAELVVPDED